MRLTSNQKRKLARLYYKSNDSVFSFLNTDESDKKYKKLESAEQSYAYYGEEEVVFLLDDTFFGSADEGIVITDKFVYIKKAFEEKIVFQIKDISTCKISGDRKFKINSVEIEMVYLEKSEKIVVDTINMLKEFYVEHIIKSKDLDMSSSITIPYTLAESGGKYKDTVSGYNIPIAAGTASGTVLKWDGYGKKFDQIQGKLTVTIQVEPKIVVSCSSCGYQVDSSKVTEDKIQCPLCSAKIIIRNPKKGTELIENESLIVTCINCNNDIEDPASDICPNCKESLTSESNINKKSLKNLIKVLSKKSTKQVKKSKLVSKDTLTFNKYTTVKKLRNEFKKLTGLTLRVYAKNKIASDELSMEDINATSISNMKISTRMKIGTIEKSFKELNVKVQIASSDDEKLCDNKLSLAKAKEKYIV